MLKKIAYYCSSHYKAKKKIAYYSISISHYKAKNKESKLTCVPAHAHTHVCACTHTCMHTVTHTHACMCTCTHMHTHIHNTLLLFVPYLYQVLLVLVSTNLWPAIFTCGPESFCFCTYECVFAVVQVTVRYVCICNL